MADESKRSLDDVLMAVLKRAAAAWGKRNTLSRLLDHEGGKVQFEDQPTDLQKDLSAAYTATLGSIQKESERIIAEQGGLSGERRDCAPVAVRFDKDAYGTIVIATYMEEPAEGVQIEPKRVAQNYADDLSRHHRGCALRQGGAECSC